MLWFRKKSASQLATSHTKTDGSHVVEIIAHKEAAKEVVQRANDANKKLKELFDENGFTVKIVLAMGAKQQPRKAINHGH